MVNEQDRAWCVICQKLDCGIPSHDYAGILIPRPALDAHTAEVVERCLEIVGRNLAGYLATHPAFGIDELVNEIRELALREEK